MDRLNPAQKAAAAIVLSGVVMLVVVPLLYFVTIAFSSAVELSEFPKRILPAWKLTVLVKPAEEGEYEIFHDRRDGRGYRSVITIPDTAAGAVRLENHFKRQYNVARSGAELLEDFRAVRAEGPLEFSYAKQALYNFNQFFKIVNNAAPALKNSIIVSLLTILISLSLGSMAGFAMARYQFRFKEKISLAILVVRMFPVVGITIPMAKLLIRVGLFDTLIGLALLYSAPNIALTAWISSSIFVGISRELEEASKIFGANAAQTFFRITAPLAFPAMAASSMYAFNTAWNDTISALILTNRNQTLSLVVYKAIGTTSSGIQYAAAGSIILILPALMFTFIVRRYINQMWGGAVL
ncbi:MAG: carbohydrate ABC transporter permease [Treponema sp.]|jgi:multiple sugar transport system permease protein|nr:carbohydrate ABC transporter permease [Treponema sp.]